MITDDVADAALCIWEHALDDVGVLNWLLQEQGAAHARRSALAIAPIVETAWQHASRVLHYDDPFDWEFVPAFLMYAARQCDDATDLTPDIAKRIAEQVTRDFIKSQHGSK